jgi:hypothetical protein
VVMDVVLRTMTDSHRSILSIYCVSITHRYHLQIFQ